MFLLRNRAGLSSVIYLRCLFKNVLLSICSLIISFVLGVFALIFFRVFFRYVGRVLVDLYKTQVANFLPLLSIVRFFGFQETDSLFISLSKASPSGTAALRILFWFFGLTSVAYHLVKLISKVGRQNRNMSNFLGIHDSDIQAYEEEVNQNWKYSTH